MMGNVLHRIKGWMYGSVIVIVLVLVGVRAYNAWERTTYLTQEIHIVGTGIQAALSYPATVAGSKIDATYPLTVTFSNSGALLPVHEYEFVFESPTLVFTDTNGSVVAPRVQITSDYASIEKSIYVRPFLSEQYPTRNEIFIRVLVDGQLVNSQPDSIQIQNEPIWFSYASLVAASILEISVVLGLASWIVNAIDNAQKSKKELMDRRAAELQELSSQPLLKRMPQYIDLDSKCASEHWDRELMGKLHEKIFGISQNGEREFFQEVSKSIREGQRGELIGLGKQYTFFWGKMEKNHKDSVYALVQILASTITDQEPVSLVSVIMELWDDFDADAKDLIVGVLEILSQKVPLSKIPYIELSNSVFADPNRRRILRDAELKKIFPQLSFFNSYDAFWLHMPKYNDDSKIIDWLKQYILISNPFGCDALKNYPVYPDGFARPDYWEAFLDPIPQWAQCPSGDDARALAFLLRDECLPKGKGDHEKEPVVNAGKQVFPVWISLEQASSQLALPALVHSAAQAWLDMLPLCPDVMLDLLTTEQQALLELLCWSMESNDVVINLIKRAGSTQNSAAGRTMIRKISDFESRYSSAHMPQDAVLLSWLRIRPPGLKQTYLILPIEDFQLNAHRWWLEQFDSLISMLFLNGIVTKAIASVSVPASFLLPQIDLSWSDNRLSLSIAHQFDAATEPEEAKTMGTFYHFHELFGPSVIEGESTDLLITASNHSLARMLIFGNCLFQKHCQSNMLEKYLSLDELKAILKVA